MFFKYEISKLIKDIFILILIFIIILKKYLFGSRRCTILPGELIPGTFEINPSRNLIMKKIVFAVNFIINN